MTKLSVPVIAALLTVGCANLQSSVMVTGLQPGQSVSTKKSAGFWGLFRSDNLWDPRAQCPNGIAKVDVTSMFSLLGLYSSYELVASCAAESPMGQQQSHNPGSGSVIIVR